MCISDFRLRAQASGQYERPLAAVTNPNSNPSPLSPVNPNRNPNLLSAVNPNTLSAVFNPTPDPNSNSPLYVV